MVIGNDSATLHIAAAHRVKAICIAGIYDKFHFFPYLVDELDEGDRLPETVYVDMPCAYCRTDILQDMAMKPVRKKLNRGNVLYA
jgi:ADP-heptose:LPS heptosyltransferase